MATTNPTPQLLSGLPMLDVWFTEVEGIGFVGYEGSINIPWLLGISVARGNALTAAIAKNAVVFCEPEWGFDITGSGKGSLYGSGGIGTGEGGLYVNW